MEKRFYYELTVGIIGIVCVLIFGIPGFAAFALFAGYPLMKKAKPDEREYQLFYKAGNLTAVLTLLACIVIYFCSDFIVRGNRIGDLWIFLACFSYLVAHGVTGLLVLKRG